MIFGAAIALGSVFLDDPWIFLYGEN